MTELERLRLPARGNIRVFLPRRRVAELFWVRAQLELIKPVNDQPVSEQTGQTGQQGGP